MIYISVMVADELKGYGILTIC